MVIWGAIRGSILGFNLQRVVRREIEAQRATWLRTPVAVSKAAVVLAGPSKQDARVGQEPPTTRLNPQGCQT